MSLTVTVDRLVYHGVQGVRVEDNDLFIYLMSEYVQLVYSDVKKLEIEVVPSIYQMDRVSSVEDSEEEFFRLGTGTGLLDF